MCIQKNILAYLLLISTAIFSQTKETIATGLNNVNGFSIYNNELYFAESNNGSLLKLTISENNPTIKNVINQDLNYPIDLYLENDELLILELDSDKIISYSLIDSSRKTIFNGAGIEEPFRFSKINDTFFIDDTDEGLHRVNNNNSAVLINGDVNDDFINDIESHNDNLYIATSNSYKILKFNINDSEPIVSKEIHIGTSAITALHFNNNTLYFSEGNKILKIDDITATTINVSEVFSGVNNPLNLIFHNNFLYINENGTEISKIPVSTLNVENNNLKTNISILYKNEELIINGLNKNTNYVIYNTLGNIVKKGITKHNENISLNEMKNGVMYFLKLNNIKNSYKFIKH